MLLCHSQFVIFQFICCCTQFCFLFCVLINCSFHFFFFFFIFHHKSFAISYFVPRQHSFHKKYCILMPTWSVKLSNWKLWTSGACNYRSLWQVELLQFSPNLQLKTSYFAAELVSEWSLYFDIHCTIFFFSRDSFWTRQEVFCFEFVFEICLFYFISYFI